MIFRFPRTSSAGLAALAVSATLCAAPSTFAEGPETSAPATPAPSIFRMDTAVTVPTRNFLYQPAGVSSSTEDDLDAVGPGASLAAERSSLGENFDSTTQPPPGHRRSYGRSRYQDRMHNADGSSRIAFVAGAGLNAPVGNTGKYYTPHFAMEVGAGINFNKTFGILGEFSYQKMGLTAGAINTDYTNTYNYFVAEGNDPTTVSEYLEGFDANAHVYGISIAPIVNLVGQGRVGAYVTGGLGFYHKTTNFTLPEEESSIYYGTYYTNATFDSYGKGGIGYNGGVGLTYKLSQFSSERLFLEARYEWLNFGKSNSDFFPYNARNTETIPITVGIRF